MEIKQITLTCISDNKGRYLYRSFGYLFMSYLTNTFREFSNHGTENLLNFDISYDDTLKITARCNEEQMDCLSFIRYFTLNGAHYHIINREITSITIEKGNYHIEIPRLCLKRQKNKDKHILRNEDEICEKLYEYGVLADSIQYLGNDIIILHGSKKTIHNVNFDIEVNDNYDWFCDKVRNGFGLLKNQGCGFVHTYLV